MAFGASGSIGGFTPAGFGALLVCYLEGPNKFQIPTNTNEYAFNNQLTSNN